MLDDVDFIVSGGLSDPEHYPAILRLCRAGKAVVLPALEPADALGIKEGARVALRAVQGACCSCSVHVRKTSSQSKYGRHHGPHCTHSIAWCYVDNNACSHSEVCSWTKQSYDRLFSVLIGVQTILQRASSGRQRSTGRSGSSRSTSSAGTWRTVPRSTTGGRPPRTFTTSNTST